MMTPHRADPLTALANEPPPEVLLAFWVVTPIFADEMTLAHHLADIDWDTANTVAGALGVGTA
jgi:hypothetical protein